MKTNRKQIFIIDISQDISRDYKSIFSTSWCDDVYVSCRIYCRSYQW